MGAGEAEVVVEDVVVIIVVVVDDVVVDAGATGPSLIAYWKPEAPT